MIKGTKFLFLLFFLICIKNYSQKIMNIDFVTGIDHNDLIGDSLKLESKTFFAFKKMEEAAKKDGIILKIVSAHRSFGRQSFIWNKKYDKFTKQYSLNPIDAINEIVRFSTIPGTSRHHWGTDIDIIDGTPLLDIKPYVPAMDKVKNARIGWLSKHVKEIYSKKSDQRFK